MRKTNRYLIINWLFNIIKKFSSQILSLLGILVFIFILIIVLYKITFPQKAYVHYISDEVGGFEIKSKHVIIEGTKKGDNVKVFLNTDFEEPCELFVSDGEILFNNKTYMGKDLTIEFKQITAPRNVSVTLRDIFKIESSRYAKGAKKLIIRKDGLDSSDYEDYFESRNFNNQIILNCIPEFSGNMVIETNNIIITIYDKGKKLVKSNSGNNVIKINKPPKTINQEIYNEKEDTPFDLPFMGAVSDYPYEQCIFNYDDMFKYDMNIYDATYAKIFSEGLLNFSLITKTQEYKVLNQLLSLKVNNKNKIDELINAKLEMNNNTPTFKLSGCVGEALISNYSLFPNIYNWLSENMYVFPVALLTLTLAFVNIKLFDFSRKKPQVNAGEEREKSENEGISQNSRKVNNSQNKIKNNRRH